MSGEYALFLGCTVPYRLAEYEQSARWLCSQLGISLVDLPEYGCCGFPLDPVSREAMLLMAARNLSRAEQLGLEMVTLCNGCAGTLMKAGKLLDEKSELMEWVNKRLESVGLSYSGGVRVRHIASVLHDLVGEIESKLVKPLKGLKVAVHTGCHVLRPVKYLGFDDPESPTVLKRLVEAVGAEYVSYQEELLCCGAPLLGIKDDIVFRLSGEKLGSAAASGADLVVTICPSCFLALETTRLREKAGPPAIHLTQLIGLALGGRPEEVGISRRQAAVAGVLRGSGII